MTAMEIEGSHYVATRVLPDGRLLGIHRLIFHWTMHVDISEFGYEDRYCYATAAAAISAMETWDGTGDPVGWHRHPRTGRRRPDGDASREYIDP